MSRTAENAGPVQDRAALCFYPEMRKAGGKRLSKLSRINAAQAGVENTDKIAYQRQGQPDPFDYSLGMAPGVIRPT